MLDLGTLHVESGEISVSVNVSDWNAAFAGLDLSLQAGTDAWGAGIGTVNKPENPGLPYRITQVPSGVYALVAKRPDSVQFSLLENESKIIDIDSSAWSFVNKGALHTQIVDNGDEPIVDAELWLQRGEERIMPYKQTTEGQFFVADPGEYILNIDCPGHDTISKAV